MRLETLIFKVIQAIQLCTAYNLPSTQEEIDINEDIRNNVISTVRQWAPVIWLARSEQFFPSSVSDFLEEVIPLKQGWAEGWEGSPANLPIESESTEYYLVPKTNIVSLLKDKSSFLYGTNPSMEDVPVYAHVRTCNPNKYEHFIVTYWFFFPYNEGKTLCTVDLGGELPIIPIPQLFKKCIGQKKKYGNHVGDWEHMSLEIVNSKPRRLFLSVHHVGLSYLYDNVSKTFRILAAKSQGFTQVQDPPDTIQLQDGHPILFIARGSHAVWSSVGVHAYTKFRSSQLVDETDYGHAWETWRSLQVFYSEQSTPRWFFFEGHWGNPRSGCLRIKNVEFGFLCQHSAGPRGLSQREYSLHCPSN